MPSPLMFWIFVWLMFAVGVAVGYNHKRRDGKREEYYELILSVEKKHPGETRHETALRYIQERENQEVRVAMEKPK